MFPKIFLTPPSLRPARSSTGDSEKNGEKGGGNENDPGNCKQQQFLLPPDPLLGTSKFQKLNASHSQAHCAAKNLTKLVKGIPSRVRAKNCKTSFRIEFEYLNSEDTKKDIRFTPRFTVPYANSHFTS